MESQCPNCKHRERSWCGHPQRAGWCNVINPDGACRHHEPKASVSWFLEQTWAGGLILFIFTLASVALVLLASCETSMDLTPDPLLPDVTDIECEDVCAGNVPAEAYQCLADEPPSCEDWLASRCESGEIDCIPWGDRLLCGCDLEVLP